MTLATWSRKLERLTHDPWKRALFFLVLAAAAAWPYLSTAGAFNEFRDAQVLWLYEDAARRSVLEFGQLPLWNPDFCGGMPALGTPQARFASPPFLLTLLLGTTRAEPVTLFVMLALALFGAHRLARDHGARQFGATLAAPLFGLMGLFACAPFLGWVGFLGFALVPWVLVGVRQAARGEPRGAVLVALSTAFIVGFGGTYVAPISLVACALELLVLVLRRRRVDVPSLAAAVLFAVGLSAFRLWPVWEELQRGPRVISGQSALGVQALGGLLFGTWPPFTAETWYLVTIPGAVVAALALLRRRARWLAVALLLWLWLAAGTGVAPSLFGLLRELPVFSLLRNSERFLVLAVLTMTVGAAFALTDAAARLRLRRPVALRKPLWLLSSAGIVLAVPWLVNDFGLAASKRTLTAPPREEVRPFHQARGNRWAAASFGPASRGSLACWEAYGVPQSPKLRAELQQESWLLAPDAGVLEERGWSPQRLQFHVELSRPTRLVINQNHHRGWKSSVGEVVSEDGLLAVELPAGTHDVSLRFLPVSAVGGLLVSALALALLLASLRPRVGAAPRSPRAESRGRLASAVLPLAVGLIIASLWREAPFPSSTPVGPEGETLIVEAAPPNARPLNVRFGADVKLEAVMLEHRAEDGRVRLELDWSRGSSVNPHLGIFVHIEPGTLKRITADHLQLSDALYLEQVPLGRVGRDIMLIDVPGSKRGQTWNVWIGLWEMRGSGERIAVTEPNGVTSAENRVLVGSLVVP
ncbi:MAG: hypothetical protein Q8L48_29950 [Archangium sp.]|nr:hypothetical protein [Archangium sp.]